MNLSFLVNIIGVRMSLSKEVWRLNEVMQPHASTILKIKVNKWWLICLLMARHMKKGWGGTQPILCRSLESPSMAQADITVQPTAVMLGFLMALAKAFGLQVKVNPPASLPQCLSLICLDAFDAWHALLIAFSHTQLERGSSLTEVHLKLRT